jgi:acyl-CoA thioester hydrolase
MSHTIPIRIYYEDTDAGGIAYHASFIRFCERGRSEFLRNIGFTNSSLTRELGTFFVARHLEADYLKPALLDDLLLLETSIIEMKNTSFVMRQVMSKEIQGKQEIICEVKVTLVCVSANGIKPVRIPEKLREKFEEHKER